MRVQQARAAGIVDWYLNDRHYAASPTEPHPDLLCLRCVIALSSHRVGIVGVTVLFCFMCSELCMTCTCIVVRAASVAHCDIHRSFRFLVLNTLLQRHDRVSR